MVLTVASYKDEGTVHANFISAQPSLVSSQNISVLRDMLIKCESIGPPGYCQSCFCSPSFKPQISFLCDWLGPWRIQEA